MKRLITFCMALMMTGVACKKTDGDGESVLAAKEILNVSYGSDPQQTMDVYLPQGRTSNGTKALVLIHGGAWMSGDKSEMTGAINALRSSLPDYAFFNVNYRLAYSGGNLWPAQINDINAAMNFIRDRSGDYRFNKDRMAIGGVSAGAHLAMLKAYTPGNTYIKAVVDMFGPTDMADLYNTGTSNTQFVLSFFMNGTPASNPAAYSSASPVMAVTGNSPPTIILHGTADNVVPIHQSDSLHSKLAFAGVAREYHKYPGEIHGVWSNANTLDAYAKISAFLKLHMK